ncbi:hypothetical protein [Caulobacter sp.]|uniref:DUF3108 domain-containing protein n=1 Tax=Caulobacter sp. TaxID=78 RepID=UPI003BAA159B
MKPLAVASALALLVTLGAPSAHAAVTPVPVGEPLARFDRIKPGVHRYLRYKQTGETLTPVDIWTREIRFESKDGRDRLHIVQHWDSGTTPAAKTLDSWFELGTFAPISHVRRSTKDGQTKVEGFAFTADRVIGLADLPDNAAKAYDVAAPQRTFNFETDMELLQALPLKAGFEASINFLHPGGGDPAPYLFKVTGSEVLSTPAGGRIDCWVMTTDYNRPEFPATRFWLAKDSQVMVKVVSPLPDGSAVVKVLLY